MFEEEKLIAFVDGMVTNQEDLTDEMYEKAEMHDEKGDWQMIFGVNTLPSYRKHGTANHLDPPCPGYWNICSSEGNVITFSFFAGKST